jgi:hypothetical protein
MPALGPEIRYARCGKPGVPQRACQHRDKQSEHAGRREQRFIRHALMNTHPGAYEPQLTDFFGVAHAICDRAESCVG